MDARDGPGAAAQSAELVAAQARLRQSEELYRQVVQLGSFVPWTADVGGKILSVGALWTEWTGADSETALGDGWLAWVHPADRADTWAAWQRSVGSGKRLEIDWRIRRADGGYRWVHARTTRRADGPTDGAVWFGTLDDVHDARMAEEASRRMQEELIHVSRLSAMGAMASVIAHDLNQPLTVAAQYIRGSKRLLAQLDGDTKAEIADALDHADRGLVRAGEIVRRVREFVSRGTVECEPQPIAALVEEACRFALTDAAMRGISYRLDLRERGEVMVDRVQIQQVLVNLLRNAVEALDGADRREIVIGTATSKPGFCEVAICDTGRGIPEAQANRMFDPFYTTRKDGMGLGLSISRMIVEAHGGTIWNATQAGQGTTIKFTLPKRGAQVPEASG
ncbi:PAS domain-containing sensor histidine kinase [Sphingomonas sp. ID1715]|uniref:sensor histidine kinase n=1 Tax=Sphingomonas sp. ID1715 TaxID=1656898 RepID=UPI001489A975|nr:PAS domain-containing sensor histidine kinase [Sphingomonas sp. ID1715]NNM76702.1 PAS domain-containing sensor histidine kinase [Sphingomonas sp. ID1715]